MTVEQLAKTCQFKTVHLGNPAAELSGVYCCDLLSIVMSKAFSDCAWVTVMGNMNAVAVASLTEMGVIVLAGGAQADANAMQKAAENNINILLSDLPVFETALAIHQALQ